MKLLPSIDLDGRKEQFKSQADLA